MYRSVLLPTEVLPAFRSIACDDFTHPLAAGGRGSVDVGACASKRKWAIVDDGGRWAVSHDNYPSRPTAVRFWYPAELGPVNMSRLVHTNLAIATLEMSKLKTIAVEQQYKVQMKTKGEKAATSSRAEKEVSKAKNGSEEFMSMDELEWDVVDVAGIEEDYVVLN